jgi:hypothetical protein
MKAPKPEVVDIIQLAKDAETNRQELNRRFEEDERFFELDFKRDLNLPKEFAQDATVLPTARGKVETYVNHVDLSNARIYTNKKGTSLKDAEEQEMLRKLYHGIIHMTLMANDVNQWRVGGKHHAIHGLSVFKTVYDADRWADKPERKDGESEDQYGERIDEWRNLTHESLPIVIQALNPHNVFPDPQYNGGLYVIEKQTKLAIDISGKWLKWTNPKGKKPFETVEWVSYWDKNYRCDLADGEPVLRGGVAKHTYGFTPYVFIDSGLGNVSIEGKTEMRHVGILRYISDLLVSQSRTYSINDTVLKKTAWPWGYITGENASQVTSLNQSFGTYNPLPEGVELKQMTPQVPPRALVEHLGIINDFIDISAAPRTLEGAGESGVRSGADRNILRSEGGLRYQPSSESFARGTERVLVNCARIFKNVIPGNMRVWARTPTDEFDVEIDKDKLHEPFTCYVEFAPISEEDEYRRNDNNERLKAAGIVDNEYIWAHMSNVDPSAMRKRERLAKMEADPMVQQKLSTFRVAAMQKAIEKKLGVEGLVTPPPPMPMQGQMPPEQTPMGPSTPDMEPGRRMVPVVPNRAPIGSAGNLQNQMAAMRRPQAINAQGQGGGGNRQ